MPRRSIDPKVLHVLLLVLSLAVVPAAPAMADCDSLSAQAVGVNSQINSQVDVSNAINAGNKQEVAVLNGLHNRLEATVDPAEKLDLLESMDRSVSTLLGLNAQRLPVLQDLVRLKEQYHALVQQGVAQGCFAADSASGTAQSLDKARFALQDCQRQTDRLQQVRTELADMASEIRNTPPEPPTVRIVNSAGMSVCIHPAGLSGGSCIDAGEESVYKLDTLQGWDTDTGQSVATRQIVVVGGGGWAGSPYTSYQNMTLCTKRTFDHDSGEVEWWIVPGLEENCGVRGYHQ